MGLDVGMREVLFQGKDINSGKWITGGYYKHINRTICPLGDSLKEEDYSYYIFTHGFSDFNLPTPIEMHEVRPETVREYTGVKVGGRMLFEKDILSYEHYDRTTEERYITKGMVVYTERGFRVWVFGEELEDPYFGTIPLHNIFDYSDPEIIGNIIDSYNSFLF